MKKLMLAAVAASMLAAPAMISAPAAAAPAQQWNHDRGQDRDRGRDDHRDWRGNSDHRDWRGNGNRGSYRSWNRGDRFDSRYARNYQRLDYRHYRGLRQPPRGYYWARSGDDAVLVAVTTGVIASIVANAVR